MANISSINGNPIVLGTAGIEDGAVTNAKIANGAVTNAKIANGAVDAYKLANAAVTAPKIAEAAVTKSKLGSSSVSTEKLENGAVVASKIGERSVTGAKVADNAISERTIVDGSVTGGKLAEGAVGDSKLDPNGVLSNVASIDGTLQVTKNALIDNCLDAVRFGNRESRTSHGIAFHWENERLIAVGTSDSNAIYYINTPEMLNILKPNGKYTISASGVAGGYVRLYKSGYSVYVYDEDVIVTLPSDITDLYITYIVPADTTVDTAVSISIKNAPTQRELSDAIDEILGAESFVGPWNSLPSVYIDWHMVGSTSFLSGMRRGGFDRNTGVANNSSHTIRTLDTVDVVHFVQNAEYIELAVPDGYSCEVYEYDNDNSFIKSYGMSYSSGETTESVFVKCVYGHIYKFVVGYWDSWNDYYVSDEFVSQVKLRVWYNPEQGLNDYYFPYINNVVDGINSRISSSDVRSFAFAFVTDYHFLRNANQTQKILRYITNKTGVHTVVFGGDAFQNWKLLSESQQMINNVYSMLADCGEDEFWCMTGNHEWNDTVGQQNTQSGINAMTTNRVLGRAMEMDQYGNYWFDNEVAATRTFVLSTNVSGSIPWTSILYLGNKLMDVPNGYNVMVIAHAGLLSQDGQPVMKNTYMNVAKLLGAVDRGERVSLYNSADIFMGEFDYTGKNVTTICYLCGHVHEDLAIEKADSEQGVLVVSTTGDLYKDASGEHYTFVRNGETITRNVGTIYEQAFDVVVVDTTARTVNMLRVGAGIDRSFSYA